jgi:heme oxygenase
LPLRKRYTSSNKERDNTERYSHNLMCNKVTAAQFRQCWANRVHHNKTHREQARHYDKKPVVRSMFPERLSRLTASAKVHKALSHFEHLASLG